jgi:large subunit ribosomal protein L10
MKTTGLSRVSKDLMISEIEKELKSRPAFFLTQHAAVPGLKMDKLRAKLRQTNTRYLAIKKSLGRKAFEKAKLAGFSDRMEGACGLVFSSGDPVLSSKILVDFAQENQAFKIHAGFVNGKTLEAAEIKVLASLPSREVLIARVVSGIQAPISRFVNVLSGNVRRIVTVLNAIAKKKQG